MSIALGDQVIVYSSKFQVDSIIIHAGALLHSRYGHFKHDDMVGLPFGSKFASSNGRGFVYLLRPTPELWTLALPHRTQILYLPDIAYITSFLDVKAGSTVIEAGTGSGSFSHSIARTVGKQGRVHSFEYHAERYEKALTEFQEHGIDSIVRLKHRNVYKDGFELNDEVDAVFLDLPAPWEAVAHAKKALRKNCQSRICCFSPCIEQVLRTVTALSELGFSDITMYEALTRSHEPATLSAPAVSEAIERIQKVETKKERRRALQISDALQKKAGKRKMEELDDATDGQGTSTSTDELSHKRRARPQHEGGDNGNASESDAAGLTSRFPIDGANGHDEATWGAGSTGAPARGAVPSVPSSSHTTAGPREFTFKAGPLSRGHTSYLTFATLLPKLEPAPGTAPEPELAPVPASVPVVDGPAAGGS